MDAYLDFFSENSDRRYPLREDSTPACLDPAFAWPDSILLDLRGFSRANPATPWTLYRYSGANSTGDAEWDPFDGNSALFFRQNDDCVIRVDIPLGTTIFPHVAHGSVNDPLTAALLARIQITVGPSWNDLDDTQRYVFDDSAPLEDGVMVDLYRQQVDELRVLHVNETEENVEGDVVLRGGYNLAATQSGQVVTLDAAPGLGELGVYPGDGVGDVCRGLIHSLSGVKADSNGRFFFHGGLGVRIVHLPHKLQIVLDTSTLTPAGSCS